MTLDASTTSGVLRAGGWGNGFMGSDGLDTLVKCLGYVAPSEGGAGPQSLARSISHLNWNEIKGAIHD
jgi:hypothetical protein